MWNRHLQTRNECKQYQQWVSKQTKTPFSFWTQNLFDPHNRNHKSIVNSHQNLSNPVAFLIKKKLILISRTKTINRLWTHTRTSLIQSITTKNRCENAKKSNQYENPKSKKSPIRFQTLDFIKHLNRTLKRDEINMHKRENEKENRLRSNFTFTDRDRNWPLCRLSIASPSALFFFRVSEKMRTVRVFSNSPYQSQHKKRTNQYVPTR